MTSTSNHEDNSTRKATKSNLEAPPKLLFSVAPAETHMLPGHVERPERIQGVLSALTAAGFTVGGCYARMALQLPAKYLASTDQLTMTHFYVEEIAAKAAQADVEGTAIVVADEGDPDGVTYVCANSYRDARTAVGTLLQLVDAVVQYAPGEAKENAAELANAHPNPPAVAQDRNSPKLDDDDDQQHARLETALPNPPVGFAIVRPPGHHATSATPLGFCLFNNVAVAARYAQRVHGLQRVMILDLDVHNGNGTAEIFWEDPTVLVVDVHESTDACYPSPPYVPSGIHAVGGGDGNRTTVNIPLPRKCTLCNYSTLIGNLAAMCIGTGNGMNSMMLLFCFVKLKTLFAKRLQGTRGTTAL
jgi:acetoin utilization deacetylase AcuC-like enzyme